MTRGRWAMRAGRHDGAEHEAPQDEVIASAATQYEYLTTALALSRDAALVRAIRARASASADHVVLAFGANGPYVELRGDAVARTSIEPNRDAASTTVNLAALFARDRVTADALHDAFERTGVAREVVAWLRALATGGDGVARETFSAIARWQPLIAIESYRQATRASMALDLARRALVTATAHGEADPTPLRSYWNLIHLMANATLLATMGDERGWLGELARDVPLGGAWTPSFALVRERCLRLALRAGWAAAAFGESATERYLRALVPGVAPLRVFDAALGLTAIGIRHAQLAAHVRGNVCRVLERLESLAPPEQRFLFATMQRSVRLALDPDGAGRRWSEAHAAQLADGADDDCASAHDGLFPAIVALASVLRSPAEALFDPADALARRTARHAPAHERARQVLLRTGAPSDARARAQSTAN